MKIYLAKSGWTNADDDEDSWYVNHPDDAGDLIVFADNPQEAAFQINAFDPPAWWDETEPASHYRLTEIADSGTIRERIISIRSFIPPMIDALGRTRSDDR